MSDRTWHAEPGALAAYAAGRADDAGALSVEAHLAACALCRAELATTVATAPGTAADAQLLARVRTQLLDDAGRARTTSAARRARWHLTWVVRPSSLAAVVLAVLAAVVVATASGWHLTVPSGTSWLLWLVAPAVPLGGVALCSLDDRDGDHEAELSTPSAGWRLVLWRTAAVVVTAVPLALAAGWVMTALQGASDPWLAVLWLLPALALVGAALALGTWLALPRAAALVGAVWTAGVLAPVLLAPVSRQPGAETVTPVWSLQLLSGGAQPFWALVLAVAVAVVVARREAFGRAATRTTGTTSTTRTRGVQA